MMMKRRSPFWTAAILGLSLFSAPLLPAADPVPSPDRIAKLSDNLSSLQERIDLIRSLKAGDEFVFSTYILADDFLGRTLMAEFADAAKRGVRVRGIIDPSHTHLEDRFIHYMTSSGVQLKEFHPMHPIPTKVLTKGLYYVNNRSHDKIWAVKRARPDGKVEHIMIEGSRNLLDAHFGLDPFFKFETELTLTEKSRSAISTTVAHIKEKLGKLVGSSGQSSEAKRMIEEETGKLEPGLRDKIRAAFHEMVDFKSNSGHQYRDLDFVVEGKAAEEVMEYHNRVFESSHVKPRVIDTRGLEPGARETQRRAALDLLQPEDTVKWIEKGRAQLMDIGIYDIADGFDPLRNALPVKDMKFYHDTMKGNVPQGSEQALIDGLKNARSGDLVEVFIDGKPTRVLYTADLHKALEKTKAGGTVQIGGKSVTLTEEMIAAFAKAIPADEIHMMSQYGILTPNLEKAFKDATSRGVSVKLLINGPLSMWDGQLPLRGYEKTYNKLAATGIQVMEYVGPEQLHAKVMTVSNPKLGFENAYTVTGSSNMDPRSLTERFASKVKSASTLGADKLRNSEINWTIHSPEFTHYMTQELGVPMSTAKTVIKGGQKFVDRPCPALYRGLLAVPLLKNVL